MSKASYVLGTVEYVALEVTCSRPGFTFVPAEWTAKMALVPLDSDFDDDATPSIWADATLEEVLGVVYARLLLGEDIEPPAGRYRAMVRLTKTSGGTEIPLLRATGEITVENG
jgi:hypothetical protein